MNNPDEKETPRLSLKDWLLAPEPKSDLLAKMIPKRGRMRPRFVDLSDTPTPSARDSDARSPEPDTPPESSPKTPGNRG